MTQAPSVRPRDPLGAAIHSLATGYFAILSQWMASESAPQYAGLR